MSSSEETSETRFPYLLPAILAGGFGIAAWYLTARILAPSLDEGIYLQGGQRILNGQTPYRDFFAFTGPLVYLLEAALQRLFGPDIPLLRVTVAASIGLIAGGVYALAKHVGGWRSGVLAASLWWGFAFCIQHRFLVNHRWLSAAAFGLAGVLIFLRVRSGRAVLTAIGTALALSVWATPSFAPSVLILTLYLVYVEGRVALWLVAGQAIVSLPLLYWLQRNEALGAMFEQFVWLRNYGTANALPYGYSSGFANSMQAFAAMTGPVLIPLSLCGGLWLILARGRKQLILPLLYSACLFATAYPRWDAMQLIFVSGPAYALAVALVLPKVSIRQEPIVMGLGLLIAAYLPMSAFSALDRYNVFPSRAGTLLAREDSMEALDNIAALVPAGSTCFVYPYLSSFYFLLRVENPARYDFFQPGMMTPEDETKLLRDLELRPPRTILRQHFPPEAILAAWPNSRRETLRYAGIEAFIEAHYDGGPEIGSSQFRVRIWSRKGESGYARLRWTE